MQAKESLRMYRVNRTILHIGIVLNVLATYSHNFFDIGSEAAKFIFFAGNSLALSLIGYYLHREVKDPIVTFWFFWQVFLFANRAFLDAEIGWKSLTGLGIILIVCIYRNYRKVQYGKREARARESG